MLYTYIIPYSRFTPIKTKPKDKNDTMPTRIISINSNKHFHSSYFQEYFELFSELLLKYQLVDFTHSIQRW